MRETSLKVSWLLPMGVLALACVLSAVAYGYFLKNPRVRWNGAMHDRSAHYLASAKLATGIRAGDAFTVFNEIWKPPRYPPLNAWLGAAILTVAGPRYVLAVLPSLAGWILAVVCGFLICCRFLTSRAGSVLAGLTYLVFMLSSPAHRIYATDFMLESLGTGLTLLTIWAWIRYRQESSGRNAIVFALSLTLLFFNKYNYWLLAVLAIMVDAAMLYREHIWRFMKGIPAHWRVVAGGIVRMPLLLLGLFLFTMAFGILIHGPLSINVFGRSLGLYPPKLLCTVAFWFLLLGLARAAWPSRHALPMHLTIQQRALLYGHILPVTIWLALPSRLYGWAFFLSPANTYPGQTPSPPGSAVYYLHAAIQDYHSSVWAFALAVVLCVPALILPNPRRAGVRTVLLLLLISATLTITHPTQCSRFLHTWIPSLWLGAGLGVGLLVTSRRLPWWLAAAGVMTFAVLSAPGFVDEGHGEEPGLRHETTSLLDVTDAYLPQIAGYRHVTLFTPSAWQLCQWTYLEAYGRPRGLDVVHWPTEITPAEARARDAELLQSTKSEAIVVIDAAPGSSWNQEGYRVYDSHLQATELLRGQSVFQPTFEEKVAALGATIRIWKRAGMAPRSEE